MITLYNGPLQSIIARPVKKCSVYIMPTSCTTLFHSTAPYTADLALIQSKVVFWFQKRLDSDIIKLQETDTDMILFKSFKEQKPKAIIIGQI